MHVCMWWWQLGVCGGGGGASASVHKAQCSVPQHVHGRVGSLERREERAPLWFVDCSLHLLPSHPHPIHSHQSTRLSWGLLLRKPMSLLHFVMCVMPLPLVVNHVMLVMYSAVLHEVLVMNSAALHVVLVMNSAALHVVLVMNSAALHVVLVMNSAVRRVALVMPCLRVLYPHHCVREVPCARPSPSQHLR
jgi:hypothetical protein